jgi:hypothetical protein
MFFHFVLRSAWCLRLVVFKVDCLGTVKGINFIITVVVLGER